MTELLRRAEAGDEVILTCHGHDWPLLDVGDDFARTDIKSIP